MQSSILISGATGLTGSIFLSLLAQKQPGATLHCLVRPTSDCRLLEKFNLKLTYHSGDSARRTTWDKILVQKNFTTIIHLVQLRQIHTILDSLRQVQHTPNLIIIGTTGVYSQYNHYGSEYKEAEKALATYTGCYCLLRPTMIYGSHQDKNLHKLIKFCDRYGFFPVFGSGDNLIQPVHAEDLAQAILTALQRPHIQGAYDFSGGTVVTFRELLTLVGKLLGKPVRQISLPLNAGVWSATIIENLLKERSPVRREQILRLQEDKAYPHDAAQRDLDFFPRSLEEGLRLEVELMRSLGMISS
ncbi:NAD-dependent epimerase/dehydratase family protein [Laspinema olomoucense]|uniref:NAD-dependent epimerase/dehydratase family protein n=1 Tax=Laspinema olomoucense TaxID=3231600 RepID=UPI0021BB9069|nr:NAD-dependent epimerase/dehydratase family protein [Laspinema sp. D3d]MCT7975686.1 NAD-dependent epimerase/dehydratase family protein [Laspinema sp. D3d]